jgi:lysophospholipase L1-like esterase
MDLNIGLVSNLTDAAGDTPLGQSAVEVTNSSSQAGATANYNGTDVYAWGAWSSSGGVATATSYPSSSIEFACTNSTDAQILGPSTGVKVQTDGGSYTTITPSAAGYSWQPIATGLSVGTHQFKVISASVTASNSVRCSSSDTAAFTPIAAYDGAEFYSPQSAPLTTYMAGLGAPQNANFGGITWTSANGGFALNSSASSFTVYTLGNGGSIQFFQDSTLLDTISIPNDSTYDAVVLGTGLTGTHTYRAIWQGSNLNDILTGVIADSAPAGPAITAPPVINACGDSISIGFGIPGDYASIDWWQSTYRLGDGLALSDQFQGVSGQQVYGGTTPLSTLCPTLALPSPASAMWLVGGVNDQINAVSQENFGSAYLSMVTDTADADGMMAEGGTIFARAILPNTADNYADRDTFNATMKAEVDAYNAGSPAIRAVYIPTDNWIDIDDSSLWLSGLPLHPNAAGYAVIANLETPIMAGLVGPSYTLACAGADTATVGVPITCTVSLAGGATWTSLDEGVSPAETLDLSASGISGEFSVGTSWNPTAGGNTDTFTFTPSSAGEGTISAAAASAGWVDPDGVSVIAAAASGANGASIPGASAGVVCMGLCAVQQIP